LTLFTEASPIGTFNYAYSFLGAAKALNRLDWEDRETHSDSPTEFLYWHSIELFLKAYLLVDGMELRKLRRHDYGHNISALSAEAVKRGLILSRKDEELLSFMPSTEDMIDLRYLKVGVRAVPDFEDVEETCENLYRMVGLEIQKRGIPIGFHAVRIAEYR
jgi:hypothetical protein